MFNKPKVAPVAAKIALRDFRDAGTERSFTRGEVVEAEDGVLANYAAAGLIGDAPDAGAAASA